MTVGGGGEGGKWRCKNIILKTWLSPAKKNRPQLTEQNKGPELPEVGMDPDLDGHGETTPSLGLPYHVCHQLWLTNEMSSVALCHGPSDGRVGM